MMFITKGYIGDVNYFYLYYKEISNSRVIIFVKNKF